MSSWLNACTSSGCQSLSSPTRAWIQSYFDQLENVPSRKFQIPIHNKWEVEMTLPKIRIGWANVREYLYITSSWLEHLFANLGFLYIRRSAVSIIGQLVDNNSSVVQYMPVFLVVVSLCVCVCVCVCVLCCRQMDWDFYWACCRQRYWYLDWACCAIGKQIRILIERVCFPAGKEIGILI